ncbi:MAG: 50S ribosomal protein L1 [Candidatus Aenigmarchaeota archaeon]|nr:50S ribosomal protein L1 [Candidatus Aenigmarchaeota archaeon]
MSEKILEAIKKAKEQKRNFKQTIDLIINLKGLDLKRPENRIKTDISLPHGTGKPRTVGLILDQLIPKANEIDNAILIKANEIEPLGKDKKRLKKLVQKCKFFIAEAPLMPLIGKNLGQVLAPRGLMPRPIPPTVPSLKPVIDNLSKIIKVEVKKSPVVSVPVGTEDMDDQKILENIVAVINTLSNIMPRGKDQIKNIIIKSTMGKPIKLEKW